ncbi:3'-5' exoribonuclease [Paraburkholderia sp. UCT31]|uniref:3'-5' exoribonuclease n=1 Tax=Paraburkholderia sp. UCT31 TaxID=2615209 RepID=UPI001655FD5D|nr:3'-5' exoribonuclease [Paraburkholderia sp. UCT31]MBC8741696.1 3'-5' exoribonuclease [Paraburkholderia sp. UCT31]
MTTRSPWKKRFFVDCEFTDFLDCELISIAIVSETGDEFYAEVTDYNDSYCSAFVREAVLPKLGQYAGRMMSKAQAAGELSAWLAGFSLKPKPWLNFDYGGDYDLVMDLIEALPKGWRAEHVGLRIDLAKTEAYFRKHGGRHHALIDARAKAASFV